MEKNSQADKKRPVNHTKCLSTMVSQQIKVRQPVQNALNPAIKEAKVTSPYLTEIAERKEVPKKFEHYLNFEENPVQRKRPEIDHHARKTMTSIPTLGINRAITPLMHREKSPDMNPSPVVMKSLDMHLRNTTNNFSSYGRCDTEEHSSSSTKYSSRSILASLVLNTTSRTQTSPGRGTGK